jgi:hypothetical protein
MPPDYKRHCATAGVTSMLEIQRREFALLCVRESLSLK